MRDKLPFSETAELVLEGAKDLAERLNNDYVDVRHIIISLYTTHKGLAYRVMLKNGIRGEEIHYIVDGLASESNAIGHQTTTGQFTDRTKSILEGASEDAKRLGAKEIGTEHIVMSIVRDRNPDLNALFKSKKLNPYSVCQEMLLASGLSVEDSKAYIKEYIHESGSMKKSSKKKSVLEKYSRDMTQEAKLGKLDPVIGRYDEIVRVMQILGRRSKNNACLVGEPGVGKTAIVEGIAQLIARGDVPENLEDKRIMSLDLAGMLAGTRYRGDFEERLKNAIDEVKSDPSIILFIDELHSLVGAGGAEGTHDAANIFKPALSRGEIHVLGATTLEEYRKYIEKDAALERRFQPVNVDEPTPAEAIDILMGLRPRYEEFHGVKISDETLRYAVALSVRYINDRFLPDKAIDILDEACARVRLGKVPKDFIYSGKETQLDELTEEMENALRAGDINSASKLKKKRDRYLQKQEEKKFEEEVYVELNEDDVAQVVSTWTKIPVTKLSETEQTRLLGLEDKLHERIVGQEEAVSAVASAIRRSRAGLRSPDRPIGAFLFLGPTGVGKTELSKALAEVLFGDEKSLIRVDMSEYMEKHNVSRMIGSPPGYVGYDEGGQVSEQIRRNPYSVVLFDEVEKAHPDVFNVLLQVLDDGCITDAQGRKVDFKNTIIIMTSNLGANKIIDPKSIGFVTDNDENRAHEDMKNMIMDEVKTLFKPEFINRLDDIIVFKALGESEVLSIAGLMLKELKDRVKENTDIKITYGAKLKKFIFEKGYDKKFGARPLRRAVQQYIEDEMAEKLLSGEIKKGSTVSITVENDTVKFNVKGQKSI